MDLKDLHKLDIITPITDGSYEVTDFGMGIYDFINGYLNKENESRNKILNAIENCQSDLADYIYDLQSAYYESPTLKAKIQLKLEEISKLNLDLENLEWLNG